MMLVLITYDVNTESKDGRTRLRHVAKICTDYGQRVQHSVFECLLDPAQLCLVKGKLLHCIDEKTDSIRIYQLGNNYRNNIEHIGAQTAYDAEAPLIF